MGKKISTKVSGINRKKGVCKVDSKSQTFSMDVLLALVIFVGGIIVFLYIIFGSGDSGAADRLRTESEALPQKMIAYDKISATNTTLVIENKVDLDKLNATLLKSYDQLKSELGMSGDFCIHFEDENGVIMDLDDDPCKVRYSIGDPKFNMTISDSHGTRSLPCGFTETVC